MILNDNMHRAVACSIASSHEDLHEVTSISSCVDLLTECRSKYCVTRNESLLGTPINSHGSLSSIRSSNNFRLLGCKMFHPPILNKDRSITTFGSILDIHHQVLHEFFIHHAVLNQIFIHHDVLDQFFIHHDLLVTCQSFPTILIHQSLRFQFPNFPLESVETCPILNRFI